MDSPRTPLARHASVAVRRRRAAALGVIGVIVLLLVSLIAGSIGRAAAPPESSEASVSLPPVALAVVDQLPAVRLSAPMTLRSFEAHGDPCESLAVQEGLTSGNDEAVVVAFGGGAAFRDAVAAGAAACINLADPYRSWVVVNKARSLVPVDFWPSGLVDARSAVSSAGSVRAEATAALDALVETASAEGAGGMAMISGFRSYDTQVQTYSWHRSAYGQQGANGVSARPGFSEHQTGWAVDVAACSPGCGAIEDFGPTVQSDWVIARAADFGFIVRYEEGQQGITGYAAEPWHLRYVGPEIARAYRDGGYRTLEQFFGLPAAPDYAE